MSIVMFKPPRKNNAKIIYPYEFYELPHPYINMLILPNGIRLYFMRDVLWSIVKDNKIYRLVSYPTNMPIKYFETPDVPIDTPIHTFKMTPVVKYAQLTADRAGHIMYKFGDLYSETFQLNIVSEPSYNGDPLVSLYKCIMRGEMPKYVGKKISRGVFFIDRSLCYLDDRYGSSILRCLT